MNSMIDKGSFQTHSILKHHLYLSKKFTYHIKYNIIFRTFLGRNSLPSLCYFNPKMLLSHKKWNSNFEVLQSATMIINSCISSWGAWLSNGTLYRVKFGKCTWIYHFKKKKIFQLIENFLMLHKENYSRRKKFQ